jgi:hypothetical protein
VANNLAGTTIISIAAIALPVSAAKYIIAPFVMSEL